MLLISLLAIIFSFLATAIMSYIAMTAPIGPWIETTLVLLGMLILSVFGRNYSMSRTHALGLITAAGGIGGILATACSFSIPTLYFINPEIFASLLNKPFYFVCNIVAIVLSAGSFGLILGHFWEKKFLDDQNLSFPIGELVYKLISAQDKMRRSMQMACGFISTQILLIIQAIMNIPKDIFLLSSFKFGFISIPSIIFSLTELPMFLSVGFITGHVIAMPLLMGILVKLFLVQPLFNSYQYLLAPTGQFLINFFSLSSVSSNMGLVDLTLNDFLFAFCSGLVMQGIIHSFMKLGATIARGTFNREALYTFPGHLNFIHEFYALRNINLLSSNFLLGSIIFLMNIIMLNFAEFSFISSLYLLISTAICVYQLLFIAGKIGLAPLGRFATFVMVPGLMLFGYSAKQVTLVGIFVEVACGVACDVLFGRKMARLAKIEKNKIIFYQSIGLLVSALSVGIIFWFLISKYGLGSGVGALPATKAAGRALFLKVQQFDLLTLFIGIFFGYIFSLIGINPALVLGGLLMPINMSLMLILGGVLAFIVKDKDSWHPALSGIFASSALWIILKTIIEK